MMGSKDDLKKADEDTKIRVLFVEDDDDLREIVTEFLDSQGYAVTEVGSAEAGLSQLQAARFDVVLSNNSLPGKTGTWMLAQARSAGLLKRTATLMMSGDDPEVLLPGVPLVKKPAGTQALLAALARATGDRPHDRRRAHGGVMQLDLYVDSSSPTASVVVERLQRAMQALTSTHLRLTVIDVNGDDAEVSGPVRATPTLVCRVAGRTVRVVGELEDTAALQVKLLKSVSA